MKQEIISQVKHALAQTLNLDTPHTINEQGKLKDDYGLDSMSSLTFLTTLENLIPNFVINPDTLEVWHLDTPNTVADYVIQELTNNSTKQ
jgi:acyl carrier protein